MTPDRREAFVSRPLPATLATVDGRGQAHAVPVIYLFEDGEFLVITDRASAKTRNVARAGRATLCIDDRPAFRWKAQRGSSTRLPMSCGSSSTPTTGAAKPRSRRPRMVATNTWWPS